MATDLYPTPTRIGLLRDVDEDRAYHASDGDYLRWTDGQGLQHGRRVTAAIAELQAADWVTEIYGRWRLTAAGRAVLEAADG